MRIPLAASLLLAAVSALAAEPPKEVHLGNIVIAQPFGRLAANRAILEELSNNASCRQTGFRVNGESPRNGRTFFDARVEWECQEPANMPEFDQTATVTYTFDTNALTTPDNAQPSANTRGMAMGFFAVRVSVARTTLVPRK